MNPPTFYYDLNSPYAWLAAERIETVLPVAPTWQPIAYAFVVRHTGKVPWAFGPERDARVKEIEQRAAERGLPPPNWPAVWPVESYSLTPLRAAVFTASRGKVAEYSLAAFRQQFVAGHPLREPETIRRVAAECDLEPDEVLDAAERPEIKDELRRATEEAIELGVTGIPTVRVGDRLFWGDDRLEEAAAALRE